MQATHYFVQGIGIDDVCIPIATQNGREVEDEFGFHGAIALFLPYGRQ